MVRIACVGIAVQDRIYTLEALPHEGGKYVAQQYREVGGGPAATAAVAAARLGAQVDFIGRVGDDAIPVNQHSGILISPDRKKVIAVNFLTLNYKYAHKQTEIIHAV